MSRFDLYKTDYRFISTKDRTYVGLSLDECASTCLRETGFICESFDYCSIIGQCRISRLAPNASDTENVPKCEIYNSMRIQVILACKF